MPYSSPPAIKVESGPYVTISAMTAAAALTGAEIVPVVQSAANVRTTLTAIAALSPATAPGAPANSLQYNNAGAFGGSANATFDGTNTTTLHTATVSTGLLTVTAGNITGGGTANVNLQTAAGTITGLRVNHVASAVNYASFYPGIAGNPANIFAASAEGASTNISHWSQAKGSGSVVLATGASLQQFEAKASSAQASVADIISAAGGNGNAFLTAQGGNSSSGSANININVAPKGTGVVNFWKTTQLSGQQIFQINSVAGTPANYLSMGPANTGGNPTITATGSDAAISIRIAAKAGSGAGSYVEMAEAGATLPGARFYTRESGAAPNNYFEFLPSSGTNALIIRMAGTGGNVPITIQPGGTASVILNPGSGTTLGVDSSTATTVNLYATPTTVNVGANATTMGVGKTGGTVTFPGIVSATQGLRTGLNSALVTSTVAMTDGAAAQVGTLTNAPTAGNPTKWVPIVDNGTTRYIPTWT